MPHDYDLEQLQRKLGRIEEELAETKRQLARLAAVPANALPPPAAPAVATPPGPAAEPPLLPPVLFIPPAPPAVVPPPHAPGGLRVWLEGFGLWPPRGDANTEARLGAWWATRVGALLAVIGVVFFGLYVSRNTPPVVKLAELIGVALAVLCAGLWLERRVPRFGPVVAGAGLALLYFSAFAAYAVPATKVLTEPLAAAVAQLSVAGFILGFAAWRRSETTATMAVGLGYVTAFFAGYSGLEMFSLWSALALGAAAVGLKFTSGWRSPSLVALPLTYVVYGVIGFAVWSGVAPAPSPLELWLPLLAAFGLFLLRDGPGAWRGGPPLTRDDRIVQNLNSSAAVAAGFLVTARVLPDELAAFWFWSGGIMVAVTLGWWRLAQPGSLVPVAACKAAGLLALGIITECDGHLRWLVLLVQAFVLLTAARITAIRGLRGMMVVVWGLSLLLLARDLSTGAPLPAFGTLVYLTLSAVLLGYDQRWLGAPRIFSLLGGALLGLVAGYAGDAIAPAGWAPAALMGMAGLLAVAGRPSGGWRGPAVAAGLMLAGAHLEMLVFKVHLHPEWWLWANESVLLLGVALIGVALARMGPAVDAAQVWRQLRVGLALVAVLVLQTVFFKGLARGEALAASAGAALVLLVLSPWARAWPLIGAGTLGLVSGWWLHRPLRVMTDDVWLFAAAAGAWALPVILQLSVRRRELVAGLNHRRIIAVVQAILATWITLLALRSNFTGPALLAATTGEALAVFVLAWRLGVWSALPSSSVLLSAGAWWLAAGLRHQSAWLLTATWPVLAAVVVLAMVALALPILARRGAMAAATGWRRFALWGHGVGALAVLFWFFAAQRGLLAPYATVLWGSAAIVVFALGLFARERVYRLVGLLGLAACVPRVFLVDIDSTLYRIVAFVVLGLVLLWVGFSYHRFRHLIADEAAPDPAPPK